MARKHVSMSPLNSADKLSGQMPYTGTDRSTRTFLFDGFPESAECIDPVFSWEESVDPDGDSIQYTFQLYGGVAEPFSGLEFSIMYNQTLDNTELSISNNFFSSTIINFYSEVNDGYFLNFAFNFLNGDM